MKILYILLLSLLISGCSNSFESEMVGTYNVDSFKTTNNHIKATELPNILLFKNKTFILKYNKSNYYGEWSADDDGDRTLIYLKGDGLECQGFVTGGNLDKIVFFNPFELKMNDFNYVSFSRVSSNVNH